MNCQVFFAEIDKKNVTGLEDNVYHFNSITEFFTFLKKTKFEEKMNMNYDYVLTDGTKNADLTFRSLEATNHIKKFKKLISQYY